MRSRCYLVTSLLLPLLSGCALFQQAPAPINTTFTGQWQACTPSPVPPAKTAEPMMCLNETDIGALRALLLQCGAK